MTTTTARRLPTLFSPAMSSAIDKDLKTVTRRVMNPQPPEWIDQFGHTAFTPEGHISGRGSYKDEGPAEKFFKLRHGRPGDILYVREMYYDYGYWIEDGYTKTDKVKWRFNSVIPSSTEIRYHENPPEDVKPNSYRKLGWYKRLGRFMPYRYVRRELEIVSVRIERLHDITEADAIREGIHFDNDSGYYFAGDVAMAKSAVQCFAELWIHINGIESWNNNPWVWRIEFKKKSN